MESIPNRNLKETTMTQRVKYGTSTKEWMKRHRQERFKAQATVVAVLVVPAMLALAMVIYR